MSTERAGLTKIYSISLQPELNNYAEIMSALLKKSKSSFISDLIQKHKDENGAIYEQAKKLQEAI